MNDDKQQDDLDEEILDLMNKQDLSEEEALLVKKLEDEGYDEEDAVSQAIDQV